MAHTGQIVEFGRIHLQIPLAWNCGRVLALFGIKRENKKMLRGVFRYSHSATALLLLVGIVYTLDERVSTNTGINIIRMAVMFHAALALLFWLDRALERRKSSV